MRTITATLMLAAFAAAAPKTPRPAAGVFPRLTEAWFLLIAAEHAIHTRQGHQCRQLGEQRVVDHGTPSRRVSKTPLAG